MSLLGDDGWGYDLARKLETVGVWRTWLGDTLYSTFIHFLSSPTSWDAFMRTTDDSSSSSKSSKTHIHLQLRVRALLFDKASVSLFLRSNNTTSSSSSFSVSKLNPNYLQLHGDDVYYTLEEAAGGNSATQSKRYRNEELPETWYNQFMEKRKVSRPYRLLSIGNRDLEKRSPEEMSTYLKLLGRHKKRCVAFKQDQYMGFGSSIVESSLNVQPNSVLDGSNSADDDIVFFPETMFMLNCVPDCAIPAIVREHDNKKIEFHGVLDVLPQTRNPVMIERLGISVEQGGSLHRAKIGSEGDRKVLGQEQALQMSQTVVAHMLRRVGFDSASEAPIEVFSQLLRCHISKLGHTLRVLADSYRKQYSAVELLKMFLQTAGFSNLGILMEIVKDGTRKTAQRTQQQVQGIQSQLHPQHQIPLRLPQQIPRQMHSQMQPMVHPQNLTLQQQQQLERMRRRQQATARPVVDVDKDRPLVQVKLENPPDLPLDNNALNAFHSRHPQMQFRQQQIAAMSNLQAQPSNQFRQLTPMQIPQMQTPNISSMVRPPPLKVEGFQELMGGDATLKHDPEENKLTSPSSK